MLSFALREQLPLSIQRAPDLALHLAAPGAAFRDDAVLGPERRQGLLARGRSPFLHGPAEAELAGASVELLPPMTTAEETSTAPAPTWRVPRDAGTQAAHEALELALRCAGVLDWRPDGVVDIVDAELLAEIARGLISGGERKDGMLIESTVSGPALCSSFWTPDPQTQPRCGERLLILLVCDVVFRADLQALAASAADPELAEDAQTLLAWLETAAAAGTLPERTAEQPPIDDASLLGPMGDGGEAHRQALLARDRILDATAAVKADDWTAVDDAQRAERDARTPDERAAHAAELWNFRLMRIPQNVLEARSSVAGGRLGLRCGPCLREAVVMGWSMGRVVDAAAAPSTLARSLYLPEPMDPPSGSQNGAGKAVRLLVDVQSVTSGWLHRRQRAA